MTGYDTGAQENKLFTGNQKVKFFYPALRLAGFWHLFLLKNNHVTKTFEIVKYVLLVFFFYLFGFKKSLNENCG